MSKVNVGDLMDLPVFDENGARIGVIVGATNHKDLRVITLRVQVDRDKYDFPRADGDKYHFAENSNKTWADELHHNVAHHSDLGAAEVD